MLEAQFEKNAAAVVKEVTNIEELACLNVFVIITDINLFLDFFDISVFDNGFDEVAAEVNDAVLDEFDEEFKDNFNEVPLKLHQKSWKMKMSSAATAMTTRPLRRLMKGK